MDGTHVNEYVGVPGDGSHFHVRQLTVFEVRDGKIVKDLSAWDTGPFRAKPRPQPSDGRARSA
jgi:predicted ester cyclase